MEWSKVKSAIGTIAPWLAGTLGSPVAGVAVQSICQVFGLSGDASPQQVVQAVQNATPEQLLALKEADARHAETMQQLGYSHVEKIEQIAADDRGSARQREAAVKDRTPAVLAGVAVGGFFVLVVLVALGFAPDGGMRDAFMLLLGAVIALAKDVYGYYFGSSSGSKEKDQTVAAAIAGVKNG